MIFAFDTETTGLFSDGPEPQAPHLVAVACGLFTKDGEISSLNCLVRPDGWTVPEASTKIHGVTQRDAAKFGLPLKSVLSILFNMAASAPTCVSFGASFDERVIRAALTSIKINKPFPPTGCESVCVKSKAAPFCRIDDGKGGFKRPDLPTAALAILHKSPESRKTRDLLRSTVEMYYELKRHEL